MRDALISGIILAVASGITVLAYRDPPMYERANRVIAVVIICALIGGGFWNFGVVNALKALMPYVAPDQEANAISAAEALQLPFWYLLAAVGISTYCILLPILFRGRRP